MKLDGFSQASPAAEGGCRRKSPDGLRQLESELKGAKTSRRKRREFQRLKPISSEGVGGGGVIPLMTTSSSPTPPGHVYDDDDDVSCPKKRKVESEVITRASHGSISVIGRRREMEDYLTVEKGFLSSSKDVITTTDEGRTSSKEYYDFFGVYDGHGGWRVAHACGERLHELVAQAASGECFGGGGGATVDWEKVMVEGFLRMDEEVNENGGKTVEMTGSTAVVAVVGSEEIVVANCGDSRAVMGRRGGEVLQMLDDHKPERPDELERIEALGGKVINWNGQRVLGVLAMSRSIGDRYLKPFVMTEPEVKVMKRSEEDEFLILASDGLWDVVSNDLACQVVRRCLDKARRSSSFCCNNNNNKNSSSNNNNNNNNNNNTDMIMGCGEAAAVLLAELAMARGSRDNISVIVVELS